MTKIIRIPVISPNGHGGEAFCRYYGKKTEASSHWKCGAAYLIDCCKDEGVDVWMTTHKSATSHIDININAPFAILVVKPNFYKNLRGGSASRYSDFFNLIKIYSVLGIRKYIIAITHLDTIHTNVEDYFEGMSDWLTKKLCMIYNKISIDFVLPYGTPGNDFIYNGCKVKGLQSWWGAGKAGYLKLSSYIKNAFSEQSCWDIGSMSINRNNKLIRWISHYQGGKEWFEPEKAHLYNLDVVDDNYQPSLYKIASRNTRDEVENINFFESTSQTTHRSNGGRMTSIMVNNGAGKPAKNIIISISPLLTLPSTHCISNSFKCTFLGNQQCSGELHILENSLSVLDQDTQSVGQLYDPLKIFNVIQEATLRLENCVIADRADRCVGFSRVVIRDGESNQPLYVGSIIGLEQQETKEVIDLVLKFAKKNNRYLNNIDTLNSLKNILHDARNFLEGLERELFSRRSSFESEFPLNIKVFKENLRGNFEDFNKKCERLIRKVTSIENPHQNDTWRRALERIISYVNDKRQLVSNAFKRSEKALEGFYKALPKEELQSDLIMYAKQVKNAESVLDRYMAWPFRKCIDEAKNKKALILKHSFVHIIYHDIDKKVSYLPSSCEELEELIDFISECMTNSEKYSERGNDLYIDVFVTSPGCGEPGQVTFHYYDNGLISHSISEAEEKGGAFASYKSALEKKGYRFFDCPYNTSGAGYKITIPLWSSPEKPFEHTVYTMIEWAFKRAKNNKEKHAIVKAYEQTVQADTNVKEFYSKLANSLYTILNERYPVQQDNILNKKNVSSHRTSIQLLNISRLMNKPFLDLLQKTTTHHSPIIQITNCDPILACITVPSPKHAHLIKTCYKIITTRLSSSNLPLDESYIEASLLRTSDNGIVMSFFPSSIKDLSFESIKPWFASIGMRFSIKDKKIIEWKIEPEFLLNEHSENI